VRARFLRLNRRQVAAAAPRVSANDFAFFDF
jgi:hypothetical protein